MKFDLSRRDVLKFAAGGAAGVVLTPLPWKGLDDVAIWTQNWSWIPKPPRGPETVRTTVCALCPRACPVKVRMIGTSPVAVHSASGHGLCALGLTAHHLPFHPARLTRPVRVIRHGNGRRRIPVQLDAVVAAAKDAMSQNGSVAVLDTRPGRSLSAAWLSFVTAQPHGAYIPAQTIDRDLTEARMIVSFRSMVDRSSLDREVRVIQIDPTHTSAAQRAQRWISVTPGREAELARALEGALRRETPAAAAGVSAETIFSTAQELLANGPAIAVAEPGQGQALDEAVRDLNAALAGATGATRAMSQLSTGTQLDEIPDQSLALLIVDASDGEVPLPATLVQRKLAPRAVVIALSPFFGGSARNADYIVPTAPFLEALHEVVTPGRISLAAAVLPPRESSVDVARFISAIGGTLPDGVRSSEDLTKARIAAIHAAGEGMVGDKSVKDLASADETWEAMISGAALSVPAPANATTSQSSVDGSHAAGPQLRNRDDLLLVVRAPRDMNAQAVTSPLMTKLYEESGLRRSPDTAVVNPETARRLRLSARATLRTGAGSMRVRVLTDRAVMRDVIEMSVAAGSPGLLNIIEAGPDGGWRTVAARLEA